MPTPRGGRVCVSYTCGPWHRRDIRVCVAAWVGLVGCGAARGVLVELVGICWAWVIATCVRVCIMVISA